MHMRGKGMTLEAINLDNTTEILSSVDHFDFNWHINYIYADDVAPLLPAGTVLHMIGIHDNTAANPRNPDPNAWVGFGERSVDDMVQVWLDIVYLDDAELRPARRTENGPPTAEIWETRAILRSTRSMPATSTSSKSPGYSRPIISAPSRNSVWKELR
jgi:hypothetical protein